MKKFLISTIKLYQQTLSPDHGPRQGRYPAGFCRHYPTCSQYAIIAIGEHGAVRGSLRAAGRVLRCNPLTKPRVDMSCYRNSVAHSHEVSHVV